MDIGVELGSIEMDKNQIIMKASLKLRWQWDSTNLWCQEGKTEQKGEAKGPPRCELYRSGSLRDLHDSILRGRFVV